MTGFCSQETTCVTEREKYRSSAFSLMLMILVLIHADTSLENDARLSPSLDSVPKPHAGGKSIEERVAKRGARSSCRM